ncbi:MAG: prohibitin family protein [bacterium]
MRNDNVIDLDKFSTKALKGNLIAFYAVIFILIVILFKSVVIVDAGKRVVVFNSFTGVEKRALAEGMHFLMPFVQNPIIYDVRTHTYTMAQRADEGEIKGDDAVECLTSDGQKVKMDLSVIYNLNPEEVWQLHREIGSYYLAKIVRPTVRSITRNTVANYKVIELYSVKRQDIQDEIQSKIVKELAKYHINTSEALIRTITFSDEFAKAVEQKQVALQESERMRYILEKELQEKQRKIIEAEGEAEAIRKKAAVLKSNPQLIQYEYVSKLSPGIKTIITNQSSIMNFPADLLKSE